MSFLKRLYIFKLNVNLVNKLKLVIYIILKIFCTILVIAEEYQENSLENSEDYVNKLGLKNMKMIKRDELLNLRNKRQCRYKKG